MSEEAQAIRARIIAIDNEYLRTHFAPYRVDGKDAFDKYAAEAHRQHQDERRKRGGGWLTAEDVIVEELAELNEVHQYSPWQAARTVFGEAP